MAVYPQYLACPWSTPTPTYAGPRITSTPARLMRSWFSRRSSSRRSTSAQLSSTVKPPGLPNPRKYSVSGKTGSPDDARLLRTRDPPSSWYSCFFNAAALAAPAARRAPPGLPYRDVPAFVVPVRLPAHRLDAGSSEARLGRKQGSGDGRVRPDKA